MSTDRNKSVIRRFKHPRLYWVEMDVEVWKCGPVQRHLVIMLGVAFTATERQGLYSKFRSYEHGNKTAKFKSEKI